MRGYLQNRMPIVNDGLSDAGFNFCGKCTFEIFSQSYSVEAWQSADKL